MSIIDYTTITVTAYGVIGYAIAVWVWLEEWKTREQSTDHPQWDANDLVGAAAVAMLWPAFLCAITAIWRRETKAKRTAGASAASETQGETYGMDDVPRV